MGIPHPLFLFIAAATSNLIPRLTSVKLSLWSYFWVAAGFYSIQVVVFGFYHVILWPKFLSPLRHIPGPKDGNFFMGQFTTIIREPSGEPLRRWTREIPHEGLIKYTHVFNSERVAPVSPKALSEVLVTKNYEFVKPERLRKGLGRILGVGVLVAEGDEHKRQRKLLAPAFAFRHIKNLYPLFWRKTQECVRQMQFALPSDRVIDIGDWASRITLDIIGLAGVGQDFNSISDPSNALNQTYRKIFGQPRMTLAFQLAGFFLPQWFLRALPVQRNRDFKEAIATIKKTARELIAARRDRFAQQKNEKGNDPEAEKELDVLSVAMKSGGFSDEDLVNQLMTFLAAGHETTSSAMQWAVHLLCRHPKIQTKLREELRAALPDIRDPNASITSTDIDRLAYLQAVCSETLRLIPPVAVTIRIAAKDTSIVEQFIPKGTTIVLSPWTVNTSPQLWDDPMTFKPERWLSSMNPTKAANGGADSNFAFMTFLHGPRSCIGGTLARSEFAVILAGWVLAFEMALEKPCEPDEMVEIQRGAITAKPRGGSKVVLTPVKR
ncbi:cytochrome P450 [Patellaria atrata CBS 101060]|uniref:Cytochrome P450 n=1 Tax=Patellaria atrata CBS 101060 TaxID=1346257 RepID=A0A9P4VNA3_9PEZI|nr:cytochrome P450 [Patellaria atrata CBS 101060]